MGSTLSKIREDRQQAKMAATARAKDLIANNKVMVFSKSYCPFCTKAKRALDSLTKNYQVLELDSSGEDGGAIQDALLEITGGRTVPRVFVGGEFFGDGDYTASAASNGTLQKRLAEVGVI